MYIVFSQTDKNCHTISASLIQLLDLIGKENKIVQRVTHLLHSANTGCNSQTYKENQSQKEWEILFKLTKTDRAELDNITKYALCRLTSHINDATIYRPNDISSRYWQYRIVSISSRKISKFRYIVIVSISFQYRRNNDVVYLFSFL